ncbi:MAG: 3-phosphoshikimate 1-carboxyvinyltransferase [Clostridia bacterium]|nr:3-phosphoshikimate 1-carboxyvinyltransferase [Clostridia bacterium]
MKVEVTANNLIKGEVKVLSSKSELHRLLLLSGFAETESEINYFGTLSLDVLATLNCLSAVGVKSEVLENKIKITPLKEKPTENISINCGESGSTLRFIMPVLSALGISYTVSVSGRLNERPLSPLYELMQNGGVSLTEKGKYPLTVKGEFNSTEIEIQGNISSQFISGLLLAFAVSKKGGTVKVLGDFQSKPYVDITVDTIKKFGIEVIENNNTYKVIPTSYLGKTLTAYGDWSNGAFFLSLGAMRGQTKTKGLNISSLQGDKKVLKILKEFGANITENENYITVNHNELNATIIDAKDIPDLIPILSAVASVSNGTTQVINAERLRIKESDRIKSVVEMLNGLGATAIEKPNGIEIIGKEKLTGGKVFAYNDHRIVMSSAILSSVCINPVVIYGAEAVNKSYPDFFKELTKLGFTVKEIK